MKELEPLETGIINANSHIRETLGTAKQAVDACLPVARSFTDGLQGTLLIPILQTVLRGLSELKEDQQAHQRAYDRYEAAVNRFASVSKLKDPNVTREV